MNLGIIGNGPAAVAAAEAFREVDKESEVVMIAREEGPCYSPCPLADYVQGTITREGLFVRDESFYRSRNIATRWGEEVQRVLPEEHRLLLGDGSTVRYDRLLIAAGASVARPPIPGLEKEGVLSFKTLADADAVLGRLPNTQRALVIGAGFIGLEAAQALTRRGVGVTVVEILNRVLPQMLDTEMAALVQAKLEEHGVDVRTDSRVEAVVGNGRVEAAVVNGEEIPCDLIINAAGVRPRLELVADTDMATDEGILVDEHMRTSDPDIYAAGDIVQAADLFGQRRVIPTWPNAVQGGRVAGYNLAGRHCHLPGLEDANVIRVFDVPVVSIGRHDGDTILQRSDDGTVRKLALEEGRVIGLQVFGTADGAGLYLGLLKQRRDVSDFGEALLDPAFNYGQLLKPLRR